MLAWNLFLFCTGTVVAHWHHYLEKLWTSWSFCSRTRRTSHVFCEKSTILLFFFKTKSRICNTLYTTVTFSFRRLVVWVCGKGTCVLISDPYAEVTTYGNYDRLLNCIAVSYRTFWFFWSWPLVWSVVRVDMWSIVRHVQATRDPV